VDAGESVGSYLEDSLGRNGVAATGVEALSAAAKEAVSYRREGMVLRGDGDVLKIVASYEEAFADLGDVLGDEDLLDREAGAESHSSDGGDGRGDFDEGKFEAEKEGFVTDRLEGRGKFHALKFLAVLESIVADGYDSFGYDDFDEVLIEGESLVGDGSDSFGEDCPSHGIDAEEGLFFHFEKGVCELLFLFRFASKEKNNAPELHRRRNFFIGQ
jgi:hypothetical protein